MKRPRFMDEASQKVLTRGEIPAGEIGAHKALSGLSKEFRRSARWEGPETPIDREDMIVRMLRLPNDGLNPTGDTSLGFVDRRKRKGPAEEISIDAVGRLWTESLGYIRPMPIDWYKAGPVIWDHLEFAVGAHWTTGMLGLRLADNATTRAYQAALISAVATNNGATDFETVHFALATFIHAHPAFAEVIEKANWHLPYGEYTAICLLGPRRHR
jgi:hypothetical protein